MKRKHLYHIQEENELAIPKAGGTVQEKGTGPEERKSVLFRHL